MNSINEYFSLQDRIDELEREVKLLKRKVSVFHERECRTNKKIASLIGKKETRTQKAIALIKESQFTLKDIAKKCCMTYGSVRDVSSKINKGVY